MRKSWFGTLCHEIKTLAASSKPSRNCRLSLAPRCGAKGFCNGSSRPTWRSVLASAALLGVMAFVGATHGLRETHAMPEIRLTVGGLALLAVTFSVLALVLLSKASREVDSLRVEHDWRLAHRAVIVAGVSFVLFAAGALTVAL